METKRIFDIKTEQKKFWAIFEEVLKEKGMPFEICYTNHLGETAYWANVNRSELANEFGRLVNTIDLGFLARRRLFRINLYINTFDNVRETILNNKENIQKMIGKPIVWEFGVKNKNLPRPAVYFPVELNEWDYRRVIEQSFPTILKFIDVARKFGGNKFFD